MECGYIYVRTHESYDKHGCCKLGKTNNIPDRDSQYATGEIQRGLFECVYVMSLKNVGLVERLLQKKFIKQNYYNNGGKEFYTKDIIDMIEPYFISYNLSYIKLTNDEIKKLLRKNRVKEKYISFVDKLILDKDIIPIPEPDNDIIPAPIIIPIPRDYQEVIINKSVKYFNDNNKGLLVLTCGVGKTLISLWVAKELNAKRIVIGVPNLLLLDHWKKDIKKIFPDIPYFIMRQGKHKHDIEQFLEKNKAGCIVITTYSSANKINTVAQSIKYLFDIKINDEAHHLTCVNIKLCDETTKNYIKMLDIPTVKQISLTATVKNIEEINYDKNVISNDNVEYFGEVIHKMSLYEAIQKGIICDYVIQTIITDEEQLNEQMIKFNITEVNDKRLFLSAYASLKSIYDGHSHHILVYTNNKDNSNKIIQFIKQLLDHNYFHMPELSYREYNSNISHIEQTKIIQKFENARFGIISCVYCLGEGWDFPLLDAVIFAENMTSNIRILQSALRGSRKDKNNINKISKIILPILNQGKWFENTDNSDFKKIKEIIYQMGIEDETIKQKITVFKIDISKNNPVKKYPSVSIDKNNDIGGFDEYAEELKKQIRLLTINRACVGMTYLKAKKLIEDKNILSKESYYDLCDKDIRLSREPDIDFKGTFVNWVHYFSIKRIYYNLEDCKIKINEYNILYPDMKKDYLDKSIICNKLCEIDKLFPPNELWVEYYDVNDIGDIIILTNKKKTFINF